jgi:phosphopantothenoylcysteine decarboxylase/phosphopantothenate--cysteine ligase
MLKSKSKILFQLSGSIACFKACSVISALVKQGCEVQVVATRSALEFVGLATLEGLSGRPVLTSVFEPGEYMAHIHLMNWADLIILCPATANTISKLASGVGDDLISTLFLAYDFKKPYLLVPAMNTKMYLHPSTQHSIQILKNWGLEILETASGVLACGEEGLGRLLEPDQIMVEIQKKISLSELSLENPLKILITSGGTREAIDGVRAISNLSTGRTGAHIAEYFASLGHKVSYLNAKEAAQPTLPVQKFSFTSFLDLQRSLENILKNNHFDAVIHAAAVSDFTIDKIESLEGSQEAQTNSKMDSDIEITLRLKKTPKLIDQIKRFSTNRDLVLIAFKLLVNASEDDTQSAVDKLFVSSKADVVVSNQLSDVHEIKHKAQIFDSTKLLKAVKDKSELAVELESYISQQVFLRRKIKNEFQEQMK